MVVSVPSLSGMTKNFEIDIFHTGDETCWVFEVKFKNTLIGESRSHFPTKAAAERAASTFISYYVIQRPRPYYEGGGP